MSQLFRVSPNLKTPGMFDYPYFSRVYLFICLQYLCLKRRLVERLFNEKWKSIFFKTVATVLGVDLDIGLAIYEEFIELGFITPGKGGW